jgi:hypothetical protein
MSSDLLTHDVRVAPSQSSAANCNDHNMLRSHSFSESYNLAWLGRSGLKKYQIDEEDVVGLAYTVL